MSDDVLTVDDIRRATALLAESPAPSREYTIFLAPWQLSRVLVWLDPRLTEGDRILARERERYEERRSELGKGRRSPYEWTCERRGIEPGAFARISSGGARFGFAMTEPLPFVRVEATIGAEEPRASSGHGEGEGRGS